MSELSAIVRAAPLRARLKPLPMHAAAGGDGPVGHVTRSGWRAFSSFLADVRWAVASDVRWAVASDDGRHEKLEAGMGPAAETGALDDIW